MINKLARLARITSKTVYYTGSGCLIVIMFLVTIDVTGRYFFNKPLLGTLEITEFLLAGAVLFGLSYTQHLRGNVRVELFFDRLPEKCQFCLNNFAQIIGLILFAVITYEGIVNAYDGYVSHLSSDILRFPAWPFLLFVPLGAVLMFLEILIQILENFNIINDVEP